MGFINNLIKLYSVRRILQLFFLKLANMPMPGHGIRPFICKLGGVRIDKCKSVFIGVDVKFDTVSPQRIHIGEGTVITRGTIILTHYKNTETGRWFQGDVYIGKKVFIGVNSVITKSIKIGDNSIIGAGSIVTKDIPENEIWAGNPARFVKKIAYSNH